MTNLTTLFSSYPIVSKHIEHLLSKCQEQLSLNQLAKQQMSKYSTKRMISLVNQLGGQLQAKSSRNFDIEELIQPNKLREDGLMSVYKVEQANKSACSQEKERNLLVKRTDSRSHGRNSNIRKRDNLNISIETGDINLGTNSSVKSKPKLSRYRIVQEIDQRLKKLDCKTVQEEGVEDKQIAKLRQEKQEYQREQQLLMLQKSKKNKYNTNQKQRIGYDYDGRILHITQQVKSCFQSNIIHSKIKPQAEIERKRRQDNEFENKRIPTYVQTQKVRSKSQINERKKIQYQPPKRNKNIQQFVDVSFSGLVDPLQNIQITNGVKLSYQNHTVSKNSQHELTEKQIRKSLASGSRKISRTQYERLKTATVRNNKNETQVSEKLSHNQLQNFISVGKEDIIKDQYFNSKYKLQSAARRRSKTEVIENLQEEQFGKIKVTDQNLRKYILQQNTQQQNPKNQQSMKDSLKKRPLSQMKRGEKLNKIDRYNLDYSCGKTAYEQGFKKVVENGNKMLSTPTSVPFPSRMENIKINSIFPKVRERVKDALIFRRSNTKKFQETLRV